MQTAVKNILSGHTSFETAHKVSNYPYGFKLRTDIYFWIETTPNKGDRFCSVTVDPKTGKLNKPKKSTYSDFMYLYEDAIGHVHHGVIHIYHLDKIKSQFDFIVNEIGLTNVSIDQENYLRKTYLGHFAVSFSYWIKNISEENKLDFTEWAKETVAHIKGAEFKDIVHFEDYTKEDYNK